jgi:hypothetical protein
VKKPEEKERKITAAAAAAICVMLVFASRNWILLSLLPAAS